MDAMMLDTLGSTVWVKSKIVNRGFLILVLVNRLRQPPPLPLLRHHSYLHSRGPFLERPGKLTGPVSYFEIEVSRKVGCVLTSNEVQFVSLAENFTV